MWFYFYTSFFHLLKQFGIDIEKHYPFFYLIHFPSFFPPLHPFKTKKKDSNWMLSLMFIYLFVSIFPFIYLGLSHFLQTICIFYKQFTNILAIFEYFFKFQNLANPLFMGYLPQHCLYLRPDPHGLYFAVFGSFPEHFVALLGYWMLLVASDSTREFTLRVSKKVSKILF